MYKQHHYLSMSAMHFSVLVFNCTRMKTTWQEKLLRDIFFLLKINFNIFISFSSLSSSCARDSFHFYLPLLLLCFNSPFIYYRWEIVHGEH